MIPVLVLIPTVVAALALWFKPAPVVLLWLYMPCLLLVPLYFRFMVSGLILDVSVGMSILLAAAGWMRFRHTLRLTPVDVCIMADCLMVLLADLHHGNLRIGIYACLGEAFACGLPYLIGRTLIEQSGSRARFAKVFVGCLVLVAVLSTYEYVAISNPFQNVVEALMHASSGWHRQVRWGFSRVAGPYAHAIFAGMVFSVGLMLQLWLAATGKWRRFRGRRAGFITFGVVAGLFMTQSRGPWIGCALGLIAASPVLFRNRKRAATIAIVGLTLSLIVVGVFLNAYTQTASHSDEDQQNAAYRRQLWDTYLPIVQIGGVFGMGSGHRLADGSVGWSDKQPSIDNEFLLRAVNVGYLGCTVLLTLFTLELWHLVGRCRRFQAREDVVLAFCLLGIVCAAAFTLTTVALSQPVAHLLFLIMGWSQSLRPTARPAAAPTLAAQRPFAFRRVFV